MPSRKIEDYAMIGDCETAALVSLNGSIDWLCWPNFASPACFASLLGTPENGHWTLAPVDKRSTFTRQYRPHTLILETAMETKSGTVTVTDFMPIRGRHSDLVRIARCTAGKVEVRMELCPRFDYGSTVPWIKSGQTREGKTFWIAKAGPDLAVLRTDAVLKESARGTLTANFTLAAGESQTFTLTYGSSYEEAPAAIDTDEELNQTECFWTEWASRSKYQGPYSDAVERSLIILKALTYLPSGGIVAAPTTSLPEPIGGSLNWDYRYCWIRDATLTLSALLEAGYTEEVIAWKQWLIRAVGRDASEVQTMYGIAGERHLGDWEVSGLEGYEGSTPVRIGNAAQRQIQQDIYGEIAAALFHARQAGIEYEPEELALQQSLTEHLVRIWKAPGSGMWEERDKPQRFTYSGVLSWLALDRAVKSFEQHKMDGSLKKWKSLRDEIRADILKRGFHTRLNSFVAHYGSKRLDASVLRLPLVGFVAADDPRMLGTVKAIEEQLLEDGLLLRNIPESSKGKQGAFLACSFWLVEVYVLSGRIDEGRALFERLLTLTNDVGLLSEEYDTKAKRLVGNFPQAFSHIALVQAAMRLAHCR
jgi:GH15 family glucan-1,4-alpha-glucosidase